jgi:phosphatidylserine decarboxylase
VARAGYPLLAAAAFVTLVMALLGITGLAVAGLVATLAIALFFRDPDRVVPSAPGIVVSPADGRVIRVEHVPADPFGPGNKQKISIFMSVFNVHVNRAPIAGRVTDVRYRPGSFVAADRDAAPEKNEQNAVRVANDESQTVCFVQVAGLIARRIICRLQPGDTVGRGQRFGMICFGSRLDVYLPPDARLRVRVGDRVQAGSSCLAHFDTD